MQFDLMLKAGASSRGGWTKRQLTLIGLSWPPRVGWKRRMRGCEFNDAVAERFIAMKGGTEQDKPSQEPTPSRPVSLQQVKCPCGNSTKKGRAFCRRCLGKPPKSETRQLRKKGKKKRSIPAIGFAHAAKHIARKAKKTKPVKLHGSEWYAKVYLKSDWWKHRRKLKLDACGRICNRCSATTYLQVHHLSYARKWAELDTDLEVLCKTCHKKEHGIEEFSPPPPKT